MSSRVSIREKVQKFVQGHNELACPRAVVNELEPEYDVKNASLELLSGCNYDTSSVDEPECEEPPVSLPPNADRMQQAIDLDSSISSAMTNLDASLTSIPETELVWLRGRSSIPGGSVSDQEGMTPNYRRADTSSWSTAGGGGNGAIGSFGSTVTDFDYLTSPGAQAERNPEYQQALQRAQHICTNSAAQVNAALSGVSFPVGIPTAAVPPYQQAVPVLCVRTPAGPEAMPRLESQPMSVPFGSSTQMQLRAHELEAYANQLMAQAMQAKAAVLRIQTETGANACVQTPPSMQEPSACANASISLSSTVAEPDSLPVVSILPESERTTVMLRNLPNDYNRSMVLELLDEHGFACCYNFVYVPMDNKRKVGLGYAFVNMKKPVDAKRAFDKLAGFSEWKVPGSVKVLAVAWGNPLQGLEAHVERYRNSPIMHPDVAEELKPVLFENGVRVEFPAPTQPLRAPRNR